MAYLLVLVLYALKWVEEADESVNDLKKSER
jgi:hypothetical protein